jgi:hypothetical protein
MMALLAAARDRRLIVSTIDATSDDGWTPQPQWGFHLEAAEIEQLGSDAARRSAAAYERALARYRPMFGRSNGIEFEVWFWRD